MRPKQQLTKLAILQPPSKLVIQRVQSAIELLREVLEEGTPKYWHDRGYYFLEQKDFDQSVSCFNRFLTFSHFQATKRYQEFNNYLAECIWGLGSAFEESSKAKYAAGNLEGSGVDIELSRYYWSCARELNQEGYCVINGIIY